MSRWSFLFAALGLLASTPGLAGAPRLYPVPGFGEPPPVVAFVPVPYAHPRSGLSFRQVPVSRICRVGDARGDKCLLRQQEPVGADCGCPGTSYGEPYRMGAVAQF